ncbi:hypothetical protein Tco_0231276 [Tanacetum coccineum]
MNIRCQNASDDVFQIYAGLFPEGSSKDGDEVGKGIGKIGGVPDGSVSDLVWESMMGGGNGSEWEVDGASALSQIIEARYPNG